MYFEGRELARPVYGSDENEVWEKKKNQGLFQGLDLSSWKTCVTSFWDEAVVGRVSLVRRNIRSLVLNILELDGWRWALSHNWPLTHCQSSGALEVPRSCVSWSSKVAWVRSQGDGPKNNKRASLNDKYFSNLLCHVANIPLFRASSMAKTRVIVGGDWLPKAWKQGRELWPFCKQPTTT